VSIQPEQKDQVTRGHKVIRIRPKAAPSDRQSPGAALRSMYHTLKVQALETKIFPLSRRLMRKWMFLGREKGG
jgi:hypothetical protein